MLLSEVADLESVTGDQLTSVRFLRAREDAEQCGLTCTVESEDHHTRPTIDREIDTGEDLERAVHLGEVLAHQRSLATSGGFGETNPRNLVRDTFGIEVRHQFVGSLGHVLSRDGLGCLCAHLGGLNPQRTGLLLGVGALAATTLLVRGTSVEVLLPVHVVDVGLTADGVEEPHAVDDVVEQVDVVADDHQSTLVVLEEAT